MAFVNNDTLAPLDSCRDLHFRLAVIFTPCTQLARKLIRMVISGLVTPRLGVEQSVTSMNITATPRFLLSQPSPTTKPSLLLPILSATSILLTSLIDLTAVIFTPCTQLARKRSRAVISGSVVPQLGVEQSATSMNITATPRLPL